MCHKSGEIYQQIVTLGGNQGRATKQRQSPGKLAGLTSCQKVKKKKKKKLILFSTPLSPLRN